MKMSKRLRRKSRKLSEAEQDDIITPPPRKRGRASLSTPDSGGKELVVSIQNSIVGTRFMSRLQRKSSSHSSSNNKDSSPVKGNSPGGEELRVRFKDPNFSFSFVDKSKKRTWKSLKQILQSDRNTKLDPKLPMYSEIEAPPPLKPPKKYSDVSGLLSQYTDPLTGLQFSTSEGFEYIRTLPTNVVQGYLSLRGKATIT